MRIANINIPPQRQVGVGLTAIFGIGRSIALAICKTASIEPSTKVKDLLDSQVAQIRSIIDGSYKIEGDLRREIAMNIKRLKDIGSYRGLRHRRGLPVRGQRTKTNARTRKGRKGSRKAKQ